MHSQIGLTPFFRLVGRALHNTQNNNFSGLTKKHGVIPNLIKLSCTPKTGQVVKVEKT